MTENHEPMSEEELREIENGARRDGFAGQVADDALVVDDAKRTLRLITELRRLKEVERRLEKALELAVSPPYTEQDWLDEADKELAKGGRG